MKWHAATDGLGVLHLVEPEAAVHGADYPLCGTLHTAEVTCPGTGFEVQFGEWRSLDDQPSVHVGDCPECGATSVLVQGRLQRHWPAAAFALRTLGPATTEHLRTPPVTAFREDPERPGYQEPAGEGRCPDCPWAEAAVRLNRPCIDALAEAVEHGFDESAGVGDWTAWGQSTMAALEQDGWILIRPLRPTVVLGAIR